MKKKRLTYIISHIDKALPFEWLAEAEILHATYEISFILINSQPGYLYQFLKEKEIPVLFIPYYSKKDLLPAVWKVFQFLRASKTEIVHAHLFDASIIGLLAAWLAKVPKRIYTRHYSTQHHVYFPRAVYYDKFINSLSTHIVAISKNVQHVLIDMEGVKREKVVLIHHGFHLNEFDAIGIDRVSRVMKNHAIPADAFPKIGVIARFTHLKGIQYIIPAFERVLADWPNAHLILANAKGDYTKEIKSLLSALPAGSFTEIEYEYDVPALYKVFDVYVHTPLDHHTEAFGQTYVEALAAGIPAVFTLSGVASEFVKHKHNAYVVNFQDTTAIAEAIRELLSNKELCAQLIKQGHADVHKEFTFDKMALALKKLYSR